MSKIIRFLLILVSLGLGTAFAAEPSPSPSLPLLVEPGERTIEGVITYYRKGDSYSFVYDREGHWWRCGGLPSDFVYKKGDIVRIRGRILPQTVNYRIDYPRFELLGHDDNLVPAVEPVTIAQLCTDPVKDPSVLEQFARTVSLVGKIVDVNRRITEVQVLVSDGRHSVALATALPSQQPLPEGLVIGSLIRAEGVFTYSTLPNLPADSKSRVWRNVVGHHLLVHNINDIKVISRPPFWTPFRVVLLILSILALYSVALWIIASLRRTVSRQVKLIETALKDRAAAEGARRERLRLSHDLHDDFQQLLAGTMFRLTAARNWLAENEPEKVALQLRKAQDCLLHTQTQLRAVLWGLQEESEGPKHLSHLFRYVTSRMPHWENIVHISCLGEEPLPARTIAGSLLMILQEAVGNAISHGHATNVDVSLQFVPGHLTMFISDNGCGFDLQQCGIGLGLNSMRDRARALRGTCEITSQVGQGTQVKVEVPL